MKHRLQITIYLTGDHTDPSRVFPSQTYLAKEIPSVEVHFIKDQFGATAFHCGVHEM